MYILSKKEMFEADKFTIEEIGIKEEILMENAGQKMADEIVKIVSLTDLITIFCGFGNNAGDGFVVARKLKNYGFNVRILIVSDENKFKNAVSLNYLICKNLKIKINFYDEGCLDEIVKNSNVIVDALFGIGFKGEIGTPFNGVISKINSSSAKIISLDIPSGVNADLNVVQKEAVKADYTLTVSFLKESSVLFPSKLNYGKIIVVDAGICVNPSIASSLKKSWGELEFKKTKPVKNPGTNKRKEGKALIVGGSNNMPGSIILTSKAFCKAGGGLTLVATTKYVKERLISSFLEATYLNVNEEEGFLKDLEVSEDVDVIACGPGLSRKSFSRNVVRKTILSNKIIVLDADALFFLDDELINLIKTRKFATVLTPHEGEMARLCNVSSEIVKNNRFSISKEKAKELNVYLVLKGPHTIVTTPKGEQFINFSGNEGLSKGGSGDVLTGIIAYYLTKNENLQHAISNAVYAHGKVADLLLKKGETKNSITPTKLIENLKLVI